jgi:uncharacterized paraquat-inducible protein A
MNDSSNDRGEARAASTRAAHSRRALYRGLWLAWSLVNLAAFAGALTLPLIEVRQLYFFQNQVVLIDVPWVLARNHELFLAAVVFVFGIVVPAAKAITACGAFAAPRLMDWLGRLAPLSFFDVFMIALLIFVAKGAIGTSVATGIGLYPLIFFAVSTKCIDLVLRPKLAAATR